MVIDDVIEKPKCKNILKPQEMHLRFLLELPLT